MHVVPVQIISEWSMKSYFSILPEYLIMCSNSQSRYNCLSGSMHLALKQEKQQRSDVGDQLQVADFFHPLQFLMP